MIETSEKTEKIASAFYAVQRAMPKIGKDSVNPHFRNRYASLSALLDAVLPVLHANQLSLTQPTKASPNGAEVASVLWHASGEWVGCALCVKPQKENDPQKLGSAITYARRYTLMALLGLEADDDDGQAASRPAPRQSMEEEKQQATNAHSAMNFHIAIDAATDEGELNKIGVSAKLARTSGQLNPVEFDEIIAHGKRRREEIRS